MTDQMPLSTCASVPAKTRKMDIPRSTTVSQRDPNAPRTQARGLFWGLIMMPLHLERLGDPHERPPLRLHGRRRPDHLEEDRELRIQRRDGEDRTILADRLDEPREIGR